MNNKKALKKNLFSNIMVFFLNGVIGFWLPPYLIKTLGIGAYGIIPLATTIIGYAALVTVGINGSLSRFLAIDLADGRKEEANYTFNTALASLSSLLIFLLPLLIIFSFNIESFISLPEGMEKDASRLFICVSVAFILTSLTAVFNTSAYVANRLDLVNRVTVINTGVRVLLVVVIYLFIKVSLSGYGWAVLTASIFSSAYSFYLFRKFTPFIKINPFRIRRSSLSKLLSMGGWLIVIQLGSILFLQIDLLVINKVLGNVAAGKYSVILQWSTMIRQFSTSLSGALGPLILTLFAQKETQRMIEISKLSNKVLTLFITCTVGVLCIISGNLLSLWINPKFADLKWLFIAVLLPLPINLGVQPLFSVNRAFNKVRVPGIFTCSMGVLNLLLAIFFVKYTDLKLYGVAIASGIVLTLKNFIFMPLYVASNMKINRFTFFRSSLSSVGLLAFAMVLTFVYPMVFKLNTWFTLFLHSGLLFGFFGGLSYLLLNRAEKDIVFKMIRKR